MNNIRLFIQGSENLAASAFMLHQVVQHSPPLCTYAAQRPHSLASTLRITASLTQLSCGSSLWDVDAGSGHAV
jgi:hypothetical protein